MIGSSENRISYNGNGIATEFAYTFKILEKSDMKVLHVAADGTETLLTKDYYVDMDKSVVLYPGYAPGEEIPEQNRPPILSEGEMLVLYREVPITQESALDKHWPFNVIENGLDKLTIICQQIWDRLQRSFYVSESTSSNFDTKVPIEAGKTFRVKDDGTGFEVTEDPAKVLPLAQGVYTQTKEQAEFAKEQADASSEAAIAAKTSETNAKNYSENVNVFLPSVSDSGVLSWTNKAGLANPASVNIKGEKGAKGDKGDTGNAATIEVGTVTTGAAGSSASVVNRGDANNAILDFILPKGADGKGSVITVNGKEPDAGGNVDLDIIPIANGGTGATTKAGAQTNLGLNDAIVGLSVSGRTITYTQADGGTGTITTQDTTGYHTGNATSIGGASATKPAVIVDSYRSDTEWYRVWSDGWVEQGGVAVTSSGSGKTVTLLKPFADTNYTIVGQAVDSGSHFRNGNTTDVMDKTATSFRIGIYNGGSNNNWIAMGKGA